MILPDCQCEGEIEQPYRTRLETLRVLQGIDMRVDLPPIQYVVRSLYLEFSAHHTVVAFAVRT